MKNRFLCITTAAVLACRRRMLRFTFSLWIRRGGAGRRLIKLRSCAERPWPGTRRSTSAAFVSHDDSGNYCALRLTPARKPAAARCESVGALLRHDFAALDSPSAGSGSSRAKRSSRALTLVSSFVMKRIGAGLADSGIQASAKAGKIGCLNMHSHH
jgi:hypothetical protein